MNRLLIMAAAAVILVSNGWGLWQARRNRQEPAGGRLEMTERELRLAPVVMESTVTLLRLNWRVLTSGKEEWDPPVWMDAAKLADLGFDCAVPVDSPGARRHYSSMPARRVFLALEYNGESAQKASHQTAGKTRLFVVDADQDANRLRARYPDREHYAICPGAVRIVFRHRDSSNDSAHDTPRIEGRIDSLRPSEIFVPLPYSKILRELPRSDSENHDEPPAAQPRYAVRICWGANYQPWVEGVRLLGAAKANQDKPDLESEPLKP